MESQDVSNSAELCRDVKETNCHDKSIQHSEELGSYSTNIKTAIDYLYV